MDSKVKLFSAASVVAILISGCSGYNNQGATGSNGYAGGAQNAGSGQVGSFSQRRPVAATTCTPCATKARQRTTYTYKPKPKPTYRAPTKPKPRVVGQHNQQYYIDRWNRQQAQQNTRSRATTTTRTTNYSGYGSGYYTPVVGASSTTYYDYSSAAKARTPVKRTPSLAASSKSIYTGSYQKRTYKPYKPTTYARGSNATTRTTYTGSSSGGRSGNTYIVKKGDTVFEIMRQTGVYWKDIIRINGLRAPYNINPGQTIRLK